MSALGGAFEQGDRDIKLGKIDVSKLPPSKGAVAPSTQNSEPVAKVETPPVDIPPAPAQHHKIAPAVAAALPPAPPTLQAVASSKAFISLNLDEDADQPAAVEETKTNYNGPPAAALRTSLLDLTEPIAKRTRAAFYLRTLGTIEAMNIITEALAQRDDSSLMRHELAYILGQMGNPAVCDTLSKILDTDGEDILVRHECAEALGAIGSSASISILDKYKSHPERDISETCQIALDLIAYRNSPSYASEKSQLQGVFRTTDPAPAFTEKKPLPQLQQELCDTTNSLFLRYRAMFTLRNMNNDESALALCEGFQDPSPLFRHEIAYVLGQMQREVTVPALTDVLVNTNEHRMVRHEAAEALGSIGGEEVEMILGEFLDDPELVVTESCEVALDTLDYWESFK